MWSPTESAAFELCVISFFSGFSSGDIFEKIEIGKTAVGNPTVMKEHLEFSNCERGVQRVG